jgi:PP-loop superfamily ATP-utilizing enzyme
MGTSFIKNENLSEALLSSDDKNIIENNDPGIKCFFCKKIIDKNIAKWINNNGNQYYFCPEKYKCL